MKTRFLPFATVISTLLAISVSAQSPSDAVNTLVGTTAEGQTFPGVGVPFGMTQWTPATRDTENKGVSPYYYNDKDFLGIRGSHFLSGSATQDYGSFQLLAGHGSYSSETRASSKFSHTAENASPYLYTVDLPDLGVSAAVTGTTRCGIMRFTFHKGGPAWVRVHSNARPGDGTVNVDAAHAEITGAGKVRRLYAGSGKLAGFSGYIVVEFDHPFVILPASHTPDSAASSVVTFNVKPGEAVLARAGTSFVSINEARRNLRAEIPSWNFDVVQQASHAAWDKTLNAITVTGDQADRRVFYTSMYHASQLPRIFSDASGTYPRFGGGQSIKIARGFTYYDDFSAWDTFRALHPLLTIVDPARTADMIQSLITKGQQGGFLPIFPAWNSYTSEMVGDHAVAIIGDAYLKGIHGFDIEEAFRLMRKNALESPATPEEYADGKGRRALTSYLKYGYVPLEDQVLEAFHKNEQVSRTLEYAYDDFVLTEVAASLGKHDDEILFRERAKNYRKVIDPDTGYARGRHADGTWVTPFDPNKAASYITEGLPSQYTFFVPQDVAGLIALEHGKAGFVAKLDDLFAGKFYDHGNEPSHHIAYLYNYAGAAYKTQQHVAEIRAAWYKDRPDGLAGNDDAGQMSAWYILSALGFYQVTPGEPVYAIGSPLFPEAQIHFPGGKVFRIIAQRDTPNAPYIQSATLNGKPLNRASLKHSEIISGGTLIFHLSAAPNLSWPAEP